MAAVKDDGRLSTVPTYLVYIVWALASKPFGLGKTRQERYAISHGDGKSEESR